MTSGPGKRGGGPRTTEGKAVARMNPMKHGVLAQTPVVGLVEREEDWEALLRGLRESFQPEGAMQEVLVSRIAALAWRLDRVVRFESESIGGGLAAVPGDWRFARGMTGLAIPEEVTEEHVAEMNLMLMKRLLPGEEALNKVLRYETRLHRFMLQTMHQLLVLKRVQKMGYRGYLGPPELDPPGLPASRTKGPPRVPGGIPGPVSMSRKDWRDG